MFKDFAQENLRTILRSRLKELQTKNPKFSLRAFARRLGLEASSLHQFLNGKRKISLKVATRMCNALSLEEGEKEKIISLFSKDTPRPKSLELTPEQTQAVLTWHSYAILSLIKTEDFKPDPAWIATRLAVEKKEIQNSIHQLKKLGLIQIDKNQNWIRTDANLVTSDEIADLSIKNFHQQALILAKKSLDHTSLVKRDNTSVTLAIDPDDLPKAKILIRKFEDEFDLLLEGTAKKKREVYHLTVHFFPLTHRNPEVNPL